MMLEKVDPEVAEMLMPEEEIILVASQSKVAPGGTLSAPNKVYITNNRVLFKDPKWFGLKANIIDIGYEDISTVVLKRGVFTTEIYLKQRFSPQKIQLPAVDKRVALQVSMLIQKGIRRELVSHRAQQKAGSGEHQTSALDRLEKLADMCQKGLLTEQEFQIMKEELMLTMRPEINFHGPASVAKELELYSKPAAEAGALATVQQPEVQVPGKLKDVLSCRYCNFMSVPVGSKFCPECGRGIVEETNVWKMCPVCDALMTGDSVYCTSCNKKFPETLS
jgi:RNA polymerase subunit RPABC4/transcription elongation factor Spt4